MSSDEYSQLRGQFVDAVRELKVEFSTAVRDLAVRFDSFALRMEKVASEQALLQQRVAITSCPKPGMCLDLEARLQKSERLHDDLQLVVATHQKTLDELTGGRKAMTLLWSGILVVGQIGQFLFWLYTTSGSR